MSHIRGTDRSEVQLLPACIEDYVPADAAVRFIDAYVDGLSLKELGFTHVAVKATGRPPYHPGDLLKLYLYGYLHSIRSSRRLEAEATRNLEVLWLLRLLRPDFKTIADFRKDNSLAFKGVFKQFNLLCRKLGLFGAELVAIDGSKFKASNNSRRNYSGEQLRKVIERIETRIEEYLRELDRQDQAHSSPQPAQPGKVQDKVSRLRASHGRYTELLKELNNNGQNELSLTVVDARKMLRVQTGGYMVGYNVQAAVDGRHDLIVAAEVVQSASDRGQLAAMAVAAKEQLAVSELAVVADKGYHEARQLEQCETAGIVAYVPAQGSTSGQSSKGGGKVFGKERFHYEEAQDVYRCPAGAALRRRAQGLCRGKTVLHYANAQACGGCALKVDCTAGKHREINRLPNEAVLERTAARLLAKPEMMGKRRQSVEHVFGTLRGWGHDVFLLKGLEKVRGEFDLSALTYNLRRVLNLKPMAELLQAVGVGQLARSGN